MAELSRAALKLFFETGDLPTEAQFADLIDSSPNINDDFGGDPADSLFIKVAVSSAQILTLNSVPVQIIAAPAAGLAIVPFKIIQRYIFVTAAYTVNTATELFISGEPNDIFELSNALSPVATTIKTYQNTFVAGAAIDQYAAAQALMLRAIAGDPLVGDSTLQIYVWYNIVDVT